MATMLAISPGVREGLVSLFWGFGAARCPNCPETSVRFTHTPEPGGWTLLASCPACGLDEVLGPDDDVTVRDGTFAKWDGWESVIVERHLRGEPNECFECGVRIEAHEEATGAGTSLVFHCPRCEQSYTHGPEGRGERPAGGPAARA
jgi:hypothetical protein